MKYMDYEKLKYVPGDGFNFGGFYYLSANEIVCLVNTLLDENEKLKKENKRLSGDYHGMQ